MKIKASNNSSQEAIAKCWTLSIPDKQELSQYRKDYRLFAAIQLCSVRLYGRFLLNCHELSAEITSYLARQLGLPPTLTFKSPTRKATLTEQRQHILAYLGFQKFEGAVISKFQAWIEDRARQGVLPDILISEAQQYLLNNKITLPGPTVIERTIIGICNHVHAEIFEAIYQKLSPDLRREIAIFLEVGQDEQKSYFNQLKEYPPSARVKSIKRFLARYERLKTLDSAGFGDHFIESSFLEYLFKMAKKYNARDMKRFDKYKRYALMICFLIESRKALLDYLVDMHDQFMMEICRTSRNDHEKKHREFRKRHKKAADVMLQATDILLNLPGDGKISRAEFFSHIDEKLLRQSVEDIQIFKRIEERGYCDLLLAKYPNFRKYFADFITLPFQAQNGSQYLMEAIELIRKLDNGSIKSLPKDAPIQFIAHELQLALKGKNGSINRNAWEMGLALAMRDKLRSGDLWVKLQKRGKYELRASVFNEPGSFKNIMGVLKYCHWQCLALIVLKPSYNDKSPDRHGHTNPFPFQSASQ